MIRVEHLHKEFRSSGRKRIEAVRDATFTVARGEILGLLGPNGAGKTTLLRMLGTIIPPTSGFCWIDGVRTDQAPDSIRGQIGFLSGNTKLYGRLTGAEVLRYFGRLYGMNDDTITRRTGELVDLLDMGGFIDQRCETLSTGQTQKVSVARVILHEPKVLILDEPTLGLDIITSRTILDFIRQAGKQGHAIVFSTHYMTEAELLCDRVALIHHGRLLAMDTKEALYGQTHTNHLQEAFLRLVDAPEPGLS
jgi:sodium transport system ATP-binding protein